MKRSAQLARILLGVVSLLGLLAACDPARGDSPGARARDVRAGGEAAPPQVRYDAAFSERWHDGSAELAGYDLRFPRYGELRRGRAVAITVTEPFSQAKHVKVDQAGPEAVNVLKLNFVQDFQTGVYDYNLMASSFVALAPFAGMPAGSVAKVSFSAQEWCGHVFTQARFRAEGVAVTGLSYFESEGDESLQLPRPAGGLSEDALWLWARQLAGPALSPGATLELPLLRSLQRVRLRHVPLLWERVRLSRAAAPTTIEVPAGRIEVERFTAEVRGPQGEGPTWTFDVERGGARRVVEARRDDGLSLRLRGSTRLQYWQLQKEGHERHLAALGFPVPAPATPPPGPEPDARAPR